ncbi:MAG: CRISPR-associated endonuclease Cas2 [bacterium]|nr:CRISPR-associated endonuclease Cas2 [bacterium]
MGKMEIESKRRTRKNDLKRLVLGTVAAAGLIGVALIAPNVIGAMDKLGLLPSTRQREYVNASRQRLMKQGLIKYEKGFVRLTSAGETALRALELQSYSQKRPRRWDSKWRVLIFDIPEYRKGLRDKIRRTLESIGFIRLQNSVWVYPYDCEDLITLLKADFRIGKDLLYLIVDSIEGDRNLRVSFQLR